MGNKVEVIFDSRAEQDVDTAAQWYAERNPETAWSFLTAIETVVERISQYPEAYAVIESEIRKAPIQHFPFYIYYRIDRYAVTVFAVLHIRRSPTVWQDRQN